MVRFVTLVGAAALLAQSAFGAAVPVRRTNHESNLPENNSYNQQYNQQYNNNNQYQQQQNNQYEQPQRNQYENNYQPERQQQQHETTIVRSHETTTAMAHESSARQREESSVMAHETTSTAMAHESSVRQMEESSVVAHETSTRAEYAMPTHGSGSSQWGNNYNDCVSQCMAQFGTPPSMMTMPEASATEGASGAIHTVMVAPEGAGLRYVPFAVNASVGDTIRYVWTTPKNHTATLSSALAICNKSGIAEQRNFVSGVRNAESGPQTFDVKLETAEPQFFYCSVGQHCSSGMFGMINPATASSSGASTANTVGDMMSQMMQSNPSMEAAYRYLVQNMTDGRAASQWGMNMSLDGIPESSYADVAANVLFTQAAFASNPGMMESNGAQTPDNSPIAIPADFNVLLQNIALTAPTSTSVGGEATSTSRPAASATGSLVPVNAADVPGGALSSKQGAGLWIAAVVGVAGWLLI